ncbi:hypothetical protein LCGC14_1391070 [marine sediment metagenome]|uniref:Uncharacterized protein n=2 Tax=root TaxID=1 RepID=A0A831QRZ1_9FLAO|nr:hypothetical protein [Pricia sp.]HEA21592.1 hypothetical protein [Pricia antarctica]
MNYYIKYIFLFLCCTTIFSCVEEQDFDQFDDLRATPTMEASILYVESNEALINSAGDAGFISRDFNFDAFSSDVFAKRVLDGTLTYIVENTTSKPITVYIELLNENGEIIDRETLETGPIRGRSIQREVAYGNSGKDINIIKFTSSIRVTAINDGDSTSTSDLPDPKIILKSSGKFRVNIK